MVTGSYIKALTRESMFTPDGVMPKDGPKPTFAVLPVLEERQGQADRPVEDLHDGIREKRQVASPVRSAPAEDLFVPGHRARPPQSTHQVSSCKGSKPGSSTLINVSRRFVSPTGKSLTALRISTCRSSGVNSLPLSARPAAASLPRSIWSPALQSRAPGKCT